MVEDTIASDNLSAGIVVSPGVLNVQATLNRITANNNNPVGVGTQHTTTTIANSVISNNQTGLASIGGVTWLAKNVMSGNATGVQVAGTVYSYGDNYTNNNGMPVSGGSLTPVGMQ